MSSQSGISVPQDIKDAFAAALADPATRALVLTIPSTTAYALHAVLPRGTKPHPTAPAGSAQHVSDIATLLPALPSSNTCAAFLLRTDDDQDEWIHISYIPDAAPVRAKMLHASSKSTLLQSLSTIHPITQTLFFTSPGDLTPTGFRAHMTSRDAPPPLTKSEEALQEIKRGEQREAQERLERMFGATSISPSSTTSNAPSQKPTLPPPVFGAPQPLRQRSTDSQASPVTSPGGLARGGIGAMGAILGGASGLGAGADKGALKWGEGVEDALKKLAKGDSQGAMVVLSIDAKSETIILHPSHASLTCPPGDVASRLPAKEPSYAFYAWPQPRATLMGSSQDTAAAPTNSETTPATNEARQDSLGVPADPASIALPVTPTEPTASSPVQSTAEEPIASVTSPTSDTPSTSAGTAAPRILFIYACPSASPVRHRMLFSTCVRGLIRAAADRCGITVTKKIETSDITDLTPTHLEAELAESSTPSLAPPPVSSSSNGSGVDTSPSNGDAWNAFGPRVGGRPRPAGRR